MMKVQVRANIFETNSSSTHSITIATQEDYDAWVNGKRLYDVEEDVIIPVCTLTDEQQREAMEDYKEEAKKQMFWGAWNSLTDEAKQAWYDKWYIKNMISDDEDRFLSFSDFKDEYNGYYHFTEHFTTPKGEEVVAFGYYGFG